MVPIYIIPYNYKIKSPFGFLASGGQQRSWRTCLFALWMKKSNGLLIGRTDDVTVK